MPKESNGDAHRDRGLLPLQALEEQDRYRRPAAPGDRRPVHGAIRWLGTELRRLRLELGISQRELTHMIGLSAHSNLGEYERGSRIPPCDIILACERLFTVQPGYLQALRKEALRERALVVTGQAGPGFQPDG